MHGRHNPTTNPGTVSGSCAPPPSPPPAVNCVGGKCVRFDRGTDTAAAAALAKTMDVAVVFVATTSSEGSDRKSLNLDDNGNELVSAVAAANPNTVVVAATPGALLTPWRDAVKSILVNFMPGRARTALVLTDAISLTPDVSLSEEGGNAAANVLFGRVSPSGKLPLTFPTVDNQVVSVRHPCNMRTCFPADHLPRLRCCAQNFSKQQYPGVFPDKSNPQQQEANYSERLLVGYRFYDEHQIEPAFPFGHVSHSTQCDS